jgi:hypothetical protein
VLINLNEAEVKFVLYAVRELAAKLEGKLSTDKIVLTVAPNQVRLTKAGRPAKKPGRKPKPALKTVQPVEQAA